jgi:hypothetical protein
MTFSLSLSLFLTPSRLSRSPVISFLRDPKPLPRPCSIEKEQTNEQGNYLFPLSSSSIVLACIARQSLKIRLGSLRLWKEERKEIRKGGREVRYSDSTETGLVNVKSRSHYFSFHRILWFSLFIHIQKAAV